MELQAGPVRVHYENGFLRYVETGGEEMLRMIYFAVRDRDWNTIPGVIEHETIEQSDAGFRIAYAFNVHSGEIRMHWRVAIDGQPDGTLTYTVHGTAQSTFLRNRLGICVLHPIEGVKGQPCRVVHPDGTRSEGIFPEYINPYQPFRDIHRLEWSMANGGWYELDFEGDVFEMEDQRNWSDASYKTYCTPLSRPFPVEVPAGTEIRQRVTFRPVALPKVIGDTPNKPISLTVSHSVVPFPAVGVGIHAGGQMPSVEEAAYLRQAGFAHLRADLFLSQSSWPDSLHNAREQSRLLQMPLELALFFGELPDVQARQLAGELRKTITHSKTILLFDEKKRITTPGLLKTVVPVLRDVFPAMQLGGGADTNYAEINRSPVDFSGVDLVSYALNPQVHAFDNQSLVENLAAQAETVRSAQRQWPRKPVYVSPVTLKLRFNPVATSGKDQVLPPADDRQPTPFVGAWTLGSLKYLAESGAASVTFFETVGERGICTGSTGFPAGQVLAYVLRFTPQQVRPVLCSHPLRVSALWLVTADQHRLVLANHTSSAQRIQFPEEVFVTRIETVAGNTAPYSATDTKEMLLLPESVLAVSVNP